MRLIVGEMITAVLSLQRGGITKHKLFPFHVGCTTKVSHPSMQGGEDGIGLPGMY